MNAKHLCEFATQIRTGTLQLLETTTPEWLTWAPRGTSNHVLWHAGHTLWLQDTLCIKPLSGRSELPPDWSNKFGMNCVPVATTRQWPACAKVAQLLRSQLDHMLALLTQHSERLHPSGEDVDKRWELSRGVIHGLHDEARHQGEMYLLLKLRRSVRR